MTHSFHPLASRLSALLPLIIETPLLHAKWLNTLSYLENSGAKKIAASEHPKNVKKEMLKHAAEEFRHALHLKNQIKKIYINEMNSYSAPLVFGGKAAFHYLDYLDLYTCRLLKNEGFVRESLKEAAYCLVTYGIELRAKELYTLYDLALKNAGSQVSVRSLLLEEEEHLAEMEKELKTIPGSEIIAQKVLEKEAELCGKWLNQIEYELEFFLSPHSRLYN